MVLPAPGATTANLSEGCTTTKPPDTGAAGGVAADHITYVPVANDPKGFVTKFGGQPAWVGKPEWPLSRSTGKPMTFIGQIRLDQSLFPGAKGKMAYLFVTGDNDMGYDAEPWDPDAGENAVIVQPGGKPIVATAASSTGPTVETSVRDPATGKYSDRPVIYRAAFTRVEEPNYVSATALSNLPQSSFNAYENAIGPDKVGGTPDFFQGAEFPCSANRLIYQLGYQPFDVNLGDGGAGFAFINASGTAGRFVSQSH
jgi:Domain of unknown function (DUF1963)